MATELKPIIGTVQVNSFSLDSLSRRTVPAELRIRTVPAELRLTSFYGGAERGRSLQLSMANEAKEQVYIQLNRQEVDKLIDTLTNWIKER